MTIKLREYRALDIDLSEVDEGDYLHLMMEKGTPILLRLAVSKHCCSHYWSYSRSEMWPIDSIQLDAIVGRAAQSMTELRQAMFNNTDALVLTSFSLKLDMPLTFEVVVDWPHEGRQLLGSFVSGGGRLRAAYTNSNTPART